MGNEKDNVAKGPNLQKLREILVYSGLRACLAGTCDCFTTEEHKKNLERAVELGLTSR